MVYDGLAAIHQFNTGTMDFSKGNKNKFQAMDMKFTTQIEGEIRSKI
jgi:hypothetical protein